MESDYGLPEWMKKINKLVEDQKKKQTSENNKSSFDKGVRDSKIKLNTSTKIILTPKEDGLLWTELLRDLYALNKKSNGIITYPSIFQKVCSKFSLKKSKAWNCLFFLAEVGLIDFVRCRGIKLNYEISLVD